MRRVSSFCIVAGVAAAMAFAAPANAANGEIAGAIAGALAEVAVDTLIQPRPVEYAPTYAMRAYRAAFMQPPASAMRYNRPCTVSDGYRSIVVPCQSAAATVAGMSYAPPVIGYAEPVVDPVVYADYARYRPYRAYRAHRWHQRGHAHARWGTHHRHSWGHVHTRSHARHHRHR
jgi:hypothetical protein